MTSARLGIVRRHLIVTNMGARSGRESSRPSPLRQGHPERKGTRGRIVSGAFALTGIRLRPIAAKWRRQRTGRKADGDRRALLAAVAGVIYSSGRIRPDRRAPFFFRRGEGTVLTAVSAWMSTWRAEERRWRMIGSRPRNLDGASPRAADRGPASSTPGLRPRLGISGPAPAHRCGVNLLALPEQYESSTTLTASHFISREAWEQAYLPPSA